MKIAKLVTALAAGVSCVAFLAEAQAQPRSPQRSYAPPPTVSPYLNLVRRGSSPAINYYGIVRPELEFRKNIGTLRGEVQDNRKDIADVSTTTELPGTGHAVYFLNGAHPYFGQAGKGGFTGRTTSTSATTRSGSSADASATTTPARTFVPPTAKRPTTGAPTGSAPVGGGKS